MTRIPTTRKPTGVKACRSADPPPGQRPPAGQRLAAGQPLRRLGAVVVVIVLGVIASACSSRSPTSASHPAGAHPAPSTALIGTVKALSGSQLDLKVRGKAETVAVTSSTEYLQGHRHVAASAVTPGTRVRVSLTSASAPTAKAVLILPASISGILVAQSPGALTLRLGNGSTRTVTTSPATTYTESGKRTTASALKVGEHVRVSLRAASPSAARRVLIKGGA